MRVMDLAEAKRNQGPSLLRSFSAMLSMDGRESPLPPPTEAEQRIEDIAMSCAEACRVKELFADTKFLELESLTYLMRALIWASGIRRSFRRLPTTRTPRCSAWTPCSPSRFATAIAFAAFSQSLCHT